MKWFILPGLFVLLSACTPGSDDQRLMTVNGWIDANQLGFTLPHEHVLVDFIGADSIRPGRYNQDSAFNKILPYLAEFRNAGGATLFECTPAFLGRDPELLKRLADASGIQIISNTGYYGAASEKFLPSHAFTESSEELAARWVNEWNNGIDGTSIRPGFMKLSADKGPLTATQEKTIHAAAIAHLETGLTIAVHNGDGAAALQELSILQEHGVSAEAFVWVHAQNEKDPALHKSAAMQGAWIEFDGLNETNVDEYTVYARRARDEGYLNKLLISHDAGWYQVGEPEPAVGVFRGYVVLATALVPALASEGFTKEEISMITFKNPGNAFSVRIRKWKQD